MAITLFRWRRRMRTISSSAGSSALIPSDLRIGLPYVDGLDVVQAVEVLAEEPGDGQLHERLGRGVGRPREGELHVGRSFQLLTVHDTAGPHQEDILGPCPQPR